MAEVIAILLNEVDDRKFQTRTGPPHIHTQTFFISEHFFVVNDIYKIANSHN